MANTRPADDFSETDIMEIETTEARQPSQPGFLRQGELTNFGDQFKMAKRRNLKPLNIYDVASE